MKKTLKYEFLEFFNYYGPYGKKGSSLVYVVLMLW